MSTCKGFAFHLQNISFSKELKVLFMVGVLRSDFWGRSQKAVSADPITDTDLFKAIILSCRIIYSDTPISIFRHLFSAWISFLKMGGIPVLGDSCERGFFNLRGGGGHFLDIFQKYKFFSPKCLIIQCIFVFTIVQWLQKRLHTAQAWFHTGVHYWSICLPQTQHLSIILISNPNIVTENAFSLRFFFSFTVIQSL